MKLAEPSVRDTASAWLQGEVEAGRLSPSLDDAELAQVAAILMAQPASSKRKEKATEGRKTSIAEREGTVNATPAHTH